MSLRALGLLLLAALAVVGLDQLTKFLVTEHLDIDDRMPVLGEVLQLHYVTNSGAAFSIGSGFTWVLSVVAAGVTVFVIGFAPRIRSFAWAVVFGLVLGGAIGNLIDRLFRPPSFGQGRVVDFIEVWGFPAIFNVADMSLVAAMGLFLLLSFRGVGLDGRREARVAESGDRRE